MATVNQSRAPVYFRPRNFQWCWKSCANLWAIQEKEEWQKYSDVENEIIEDAFIDKIFNVELDDDNIVNLKQNFQYRKGDTKRQCLVKRISLDKDRHSMHIREERFACPMKLATTTNKIQDTDLDDDALFALYHGGLANAYWYTMLQWENKSHADIIEEAAQGISKEGSSIGKQKEAQWLAEQLRNTKYSDGCAGACFGTVSPEIGPTCVFLYSMESFLYKLINRVLRQPETITLEKIKTFGPFCWLLYRYLYNIKTTKGLTVYRGLTLTDKEREDFMADDIRFRSFTSTSKNIEVAEMYGGNTLLIIDLHVLLYGKKAEDNIRCGADISHLSSFPDEEEFLIWPETTFHHVEHYYNNESKKNIVHLKSSVENSA